MAGQLHSWNPVSCGFQGWCTKVSQVWFEEVLVLKNGRMQKFKGDEGEELLPEGPGDPTAGFQP